jgi:hypothetical protein
MDAGDVLKELRGLGALGRVRRPEREVEASKTPSGVWERDPRIAPTQEALRAVAERLSALRQAESDFDIALKRVFDIWEGDPPLEAAEVSSGGEEVLSTPAPPVRKVIRDVPKIEASPEEIRLAREAARRKILGEDITDEALRRRVLEGEEDDVPFVGQVRVTAESAIMGETTVGTFGTVKPSFPQEVKSDA